MDLSIEKKVCQWIYEAEEEEKRTHVLANLIYPDHTIEEHVLMAENEINTNKRRFS